MRLKTKCRLNRCGMVRFLAGMLGVFVCSMAFGQVGEVTLEAEISRSRAYVGDVVSYQILVRGADDGTPPVVEFPSEVQAEYRGVSSQKFTNIRTINGRQRSQTDAYYKHQYVLTVVGEGRVVIPPAVLVLGKGQFESNEIVFDALLPGRAEMDILEVELPDRDVYIGESAVVHVTWWIADKTSDISFESSVLPESMRIVGGGTQSRTMQEVSLSIRGQRFSAFADQGMYQGKPMTRLRFDLLVTPRKQGEFEFGPLRVVFTRQDDFMRASRKYVESEAKTMRVVDVPLDGRPAGYQGLIGVFSADSEASNTKVNVGDPIDIRLVVRGSEPMIGIQKTLDSQDFEGHGFRVSPDGWRLLERRRNGERLFSTTIRAANADITEVPAIRLPAFNPTTGSFEVFESSPIALDVRAVQTVTLSDAVVDGQVQGDVKIDRKELQENPSVLWTHRNADELRSSARSFSMKSVLIDPVWVSVLIGIFGVPMVSWIWIRTRANRDSQSAAIHRAWKQARRLHRRGDDVGAIRVYGGAILGIDPKSLTGADIKSLAMSEEITQRSMKVLGESENMNYGSIQRVESDASTDASLLRAMRSDIRRHGARRAGDGTRRTGR